MLRLTHSISSFYSSYSFSSFVSSVSLIHYHENMTKLTAQDVAHIAKLARLNLTPEELEKFSTELTQILTYIEKLSEVETDGVEVTANVTGQSNNFHEDTIKEDGPSREELLSCSPLPIIESQIQTPSAHG